ncbi:MULTISPECIES: DJ-1/PfpI family protein [unclassified Uliginosibacterium]|uniref:DJ-1/PfpI family protein n=1 Tax=unclassified Uliginosibacterium TaxID=2621521 RepID=UPI000C795BE0|nr:MULTISPECIES: DJ-1/PfpI family protein [unclassified Uliginosibacterium]MDO6384806.1 DJ-1/PfpI family protein [Uliginosibacterium sp. 31-12]PLK48890.1 thiamine biosynthesis protein ThiJ [Uliginosibacterium sp. TH139]
MTLAVAIYLFPDAEVLDFAGPYEVFTTASRVHKRRVPEAEELFRVFTVAATPGLVRARAGMEVKADFGFDTHPPLDLLIVPGGVVTQELERPGLTEWIQRNHAMTRITASVCTGAFLLAQAGLLEGLQATTHWEDVPDLRAMFPALQVLEGRRWVDQGRVVTSAGISAGIDMSLHLVERLAGRELALATARQMEVDWSQN